MPAFVIVIGNKIVFVYVYVLETMAMDVQEVFIWSMFNLNFLVNSKK